MIDVTVLGCGFMGENHVRAVAEHPSLRLTSVVDVDESRAQNVADQYGANEAVTDYEEALADADATIIATPERFHAEQAITALEEGVHLLLEKPITADLDTARELADRTSASNLVTGVSFILRYDPAYATAQEAAMEGNLGDLVSARVKRGITLEESRRIGARGHPLFYMSIHDIDAVLASTSQSISDVVAFERRGELADVDVPDATQALLRFDGGFTATVEGYGILPDDTPGMIDAAFELYGTDGVASVDTPGNTLTVHADRFDRPDTRHWPVINDRMDGAVAKQVNRFATAVQTDAPMLATVADGYRAQLVAEAMLDSLESGDIIEVDDPGR
jgi:UDP-N-acetylglucosamine 3-dehydrogenase